MRLRRALRPEAHITSLHLLVETVATKAQGVRDLLVEQLDNPGLFKAGWYGADGHSARLAIASAMPWLIEAERARAEAAILALRTEIACAKRALARAVSDTHAPQPPSRHRSSTRHCLYPLGNTEHLATT